MSWTTQQPVQTGWYFYAGHYQTQCAHACTPVYVSQRSDGAWVVKGKPMQHYRGHWWTQRIPEPPEARFE